MEPNRAQEQYFFDEATVAFLGRNLAAYAHPCCLCCPLPGQWLAQQGHRATILDTDRRFQTVVGYRYYDLHAPTWLGDDFGIILCDPPFFNVSLRELEHAIRMLARYDYAQPLVLCYLERREAALLRVFARYGLRPTDKVLGYQDVTPKAKNRIVLYTNVELLR